MGCTSEPERIIDYQRYFIVMRNLTRQKIRISWTISNSKTHLSELWKGRNVVTWVTNALDVNGLSLLIDSGCERLGIGVDYKLDPDVVLLKED